MSAWWYIEEKMVDGSGLTNEPSSLPQQVHEAVDRLCELLPVSTETHSLTIWFNNDGEAK